MAGTGILRFTPTPTQARTRQKVAYFTTAILLILTVLEAAFVSTNFSQLQPLPAIIAAVIMLGLVGTNYVFLERSIVTLTSDHAEKKRIYDEYDAQTHMLGEDEKVPTKPQKEKRGRAVLVWLTRVVSVLLVWAFSLALISAVSVHITLQLPNGAQQWAGPIVGVIVAIVYSKIFSIFNRVVHKAPSTKKLAKMREAEEPESIYDILGV